MDVPSGGIRLSLCDSNSAFIRLLADVMMIWYIVAVGIHRLCGNYFTVSHMHVNNIACVQMLWQR